MNQQEARIPAINQRLKDRRTRCVTNINPIYLRPPSVCDHHHHHHHRRRHYNWRRFNPSRVPR